MINKQKILIVEDESLTARWLEMELSKEGYDICGLVTTGEEAVIVAQKKQPNFILMDIRLAGEIDGITAAEEIIKNMTVDVIIMTAYSQKRIRERIKLLNPRAFINKPIEISDIIDVIKS